ncbi:MAG: hypothetical protein ABIP17_02910 [Ilumatobacteraceae bacterium]
MLQRRLNLLTLALAAVVLPACAGVDGTERGAIRENVIEPGITAMDQSRELACGTDARTLQTALDAYAALEGSPAPDEAALIASGFLREESPAWDVSGGILVPQSDSCGPVPANATASTVEIVTEKATLTVAEVLSTFTTDDVASFGGDACAQQLAVVFAGVSSYVDATGTEPGTIDDVEAAGYFAVPVTMWQVVDDSIRPVAGSGCLDFIGTPVTTDP